MLNTNHCAVYCSNTLVLCSHNDGYPNLDIFFIILRVNYLELLYLHISTLIPAGINNNMPSNVWNQITYPVQTFNRATVKIWEWEWIFIPHFIVDVIIYKLFSCEYHENSLMRNQQWLGVVKQQDISLWTMVQIHWNSSTMTHCVYENKINIAFDKWPIHGSFHSKPRL